MGLTPSERRVLAATLALVVALAGWLFGWWPWQVLLPVLAVGAIVISRLPTISDTAQRDPDEGR